MCAIGVPVGGVGGDGFVYVLQIFCGFAKLWEADLCMSGRPAIVLFYYTLFLWLLL